MSSRLKASLFSRSQRHFQSQRNVINLFLICKTYTQSHRLRTDVHMLMSPIPAYPALHTPPPHRWRGPSADGESMQETGRCLGLWPSHLASSLPCSLHLPLLPFSEVILGLNTAQVALVQKNIFSWLQIMQNSLLLTDPRVRIIHFPELTGFHTKSLSQDTCFK